MEDIKYIAFYLPQFHEIPENNKWWGNGFTEWTNVKKAQPLFDGHIQPKKPTTLGYYNLLDSKVFDQQISLAKDNNISAFCFYHYWFGNGKKLLEKPVEKYLRSRNLDFDYCLCWANESWKGIWHGKPNLVLQKQNYPGTADIIKHIKYLLPFFEDNRYLKINGKPLFIIHRFSSMYSLGDYFNQYQELLWNHYKIELFVLSGYGDKDKWHKDYSPHVNGKISSYFEELTQNRRQANYSKNIISKIMMNKKLFPLRIDYEEFTDLLISELNERKTFYPMIIPNWDNTPRVGKKFGSVLVNVHPSQLRRQIELTSSFVKNNEELEKMIFIKSWNEWAEGNYLEPDEEFDDSLIVQFKQTL